jgi:hypothetical protein
MRLPDVQQASNASIATDCHDVGVGTLSLGPHMTGKTSHDPRDIAGAISNTWLFLREAVLVETSTGSSHLRQSRKPSAFQKGARVIFMHLS